MTPHPNRLRKNRFLVPGQAGGRQAGDLDIPRNCRGASELPVNAGCGGSLSPQPAGPNPQRARLLLGRLLPLLLLAATATVSEVAFGEQDSRRDGWRPKQGAVVQTLATEELQADETGPPAPAPAPAPIPEPDARVAPAVAEELTSPPLPTEAADAPETTTVPATLTEQMTAAGPPAAPQLTAAIPACIQCGATCNLIPFCRCEPITRKKPRTIYESKCELVCEPAVGLFGPPPPKPNGCTDCGKTCSPARICKKKTLLKTVHEEDVCHTARKVGYLCRCCAGECGGCDEDGCASKPAGQRPPLCGWQPFAWLEKLWPSRR